MINLKLKIVNKNYIFCYLKGDKTYRNVNKVI